MNKRVWSFFNPVAIFATLVFSSCSDFQNKEQSQSQNVEAKVLAETLTIDPPLEGIEVPFSNNTVDAEKGGEITLANNSRIVVPPNAFVDKAGLPVKGEVTLKYREFHSIEDVMVSGIPMTYKSGDDFQNFVTAGMFEIKGEANGEEVEIAPEKQIEVNMASYTTNPSAKFYVFNPKTKQWEYVEDSRMQPLAKSEKKVGREMEKPSLPNKVDQDAFKFDLALDYSRFPELKKHKGVIWQYVPKNGYDDPQKDNLYYSQQWVGIELKPFNLEKKEYELVLNSKDNSFKSIVTPVLGERSFKKAQAQYQKDMEKYLANVSVASSLNKQQAEVNRQMSISSFGTYNHDYFYQASNPVVAKLQLKIIGADTLSSSLLSAFLVMKSKNAVIRYTENGYDNFQHFTFDKKENNALIVILPKKKIAVFSPEEFKAATSKGNICTFEVNNTTQVASLKDMADVIKSL